MDPHVLGRGRADEAAIIEELSDPVAVGHPDRRWLLAIAGMAAIVCFGFVGSAMSPPKPVDPERLPGSPAMVEGPGPSTTPPTPLIKLLAPADGASVTGGRVAVRLLAAPNRQVLVAVTVGAAVLGWRMVLSDASGAWEGDVKVFAPRVALPAVVRVVAPLGRATVEASAGIVLAGGAQVVLWDASVADGLGKVPTVRYRATAPLDFTGMTAWVTDGDGDGRWLGKRSNTARVEAMQPGSAGGRELGLGSISGVIPAVARSHGRSCSTSRGTTRQQEPRARSFGSS